VGFFEVFAGALAAFYAVVPEYGAAIVLLTVAVRLILLPLTIKQTRSMREMAKIQPEIKKIQQKHKGDRQKMNEEMMALYKERGVNPFGGCLPLLMQMPVFIALYRVLLTPLSYMGFTQTEAEVWEPQQVEGTMAAVQGSDLANDLLRIPNEVNNFLGIRLDCAASAAGGWGEGFNGAAGCGTGPVDAIPYLLLIGLMGYTTFFQQKQMMRGRDPKDPQARQMQMIGKIMPLFLMFIGFNFPAGLVLYWSVTNLWTIGQQQVMLPASVAAAAAAKADKVDKGEEKKPEAKPQGSSPAARGSGGAGAAPEGSKSRQKKQGSRKKKKKKRKR
jgi:YidC/Oxa1 family membrane protein insertase